jgi:signal transduction histidine kinase
MPIPTPIPAGRSSSNLGTPERLLKRPPPWARKAHSPGRPAVSACDLAMGDPTHFSRHDLDRQRERVRRSFLRANTAVAAVLVTVCGLAFAAVVASFRSAQQQRRAEAAEFEARDRLGHAYLAQARAARLGGQHGRRLEILTLVSNATALRPSAALRTEAIAALALTDVEIEGSIHPLTLPFKQVFQGGLAHYAVADPFGAIDLYRSDDHARVGRLAHETTGLPGAALLADLEFTRDGRYLVVRYKNDAFVVWDVPHRTPWYLRPPDARRGRQGVCLSQDGYLAITTERTEATEVERVELLTGQSRKWTFPPGLQNGCLRPGGRQIAFTTGTEVQLRDLDTGTLLRTFSHPIPIRSMAWSPDGTQFATASAGGTLHLWNLDEGGSHRLTGHTEGVSTLIFSPDGTLLLSKAGDDTSRLWDARKGRALLVAEGFQATEFSADSQRLGFARAVEGVGFWRLRRSDVLRVVSGISGTHGTLHHLDLSPDGQRLATVDGEGIQLWNLAEPGPAGFTPLPEVGSLTFLPDGQRVLLARQGGLELRPVVAAPAPQPPTASTPPAATTAASRTPGGPTLGDAEPLALPSGFAARHATVSLDGSTVLAEGTDLRLAILDLRNQRPPVLLTGRQRFYHTLSPASGTGSGRLAISPDGRWAAVGYGMQVAGVGSSAGDDQDPGRNATVFDTRTGTAVLVPEGHGGILFSPDGQWFILRTARHCRWYRTGTWTQERQVTLDNLDTHIGIGAMDSAGSILALSRSRQSVALLQPAQGEEWATLLPPNPASLNRARCSADGQRLVLGTTENQVQVWDLGQVGRELSRLGLGDPTALSAAGTRPALSQGPRSPDPFQTITFGLSGSVIAVVSGWVVLRRHRVLIQRFVRTEAIVEKRNHQLELARRELLQADKLKALGTLAAGLAHDFNNLLSVIRMSSQLIPRARSREEVAEYVEAVERAVLQGKALVGSMLGYSREGAPGHQTVDIPALVEQTVLLLSREFLSGVDLRRDLDPTTPVVQLNQGKLHQILLNLLVNASEALQGRGVLQLTVRPLDRLPTHPDLRFAARPRSADRYVEIGVTDSGPGIPPEILDRIFEPFFTTKRAGTRKGTGLGLSMVHSLAVQEGLGLAVSSVPDSGASFHLYLPVHPEPSGRP